MPLLVSIKGVANSLIESLHILSYFSLSELLPVGNWTELRGLTDDSLGVGEESYLRLPENNSISYFNLGYFEKIDFQHVPNGATLIYNDFHQFLTPDVCNQLRSRWIKLNS